MLNIDRHIAVQAGWVAGPAFGVAMMAAPEYLHLGPLWSGLAFWGGIIVFLATLAVVVFLSLHEKGKQKAVLGPVLVMALGAAVFCGGAAWYFWPTMGKPSEEQAELSPLDNIIQINCEPAQAPAVMPQNKMFELRLYHPGVVAGGAFTSYTAPPGSQIDMTKESPSQAWLCRVSNFGASAVINVVAEIAVKFRTNGGVGYDVVHAGRIGTPPMNLSGNGGACDIYVRNFSPDHFAEVLLPAMATGQMGGSATRQDFKLASARFGGFILRPLSLEPSQKPRPADIPLPRPHPG